MSFILMTAEESGSEGSVNTSTYLLRSRRRGGYWGVQSRTRGLKELLRAQAIIGVRKAVLTREGVSLICWCRKIQCRIGGGGAFNCREDRITKKMSVAWNKAASSRPGPRRGTSFSVDLQRLEKVDNFNVSMKQAQKENQKTVFEKWRLFDLGCLKSVSEVWNSTPTSQGRRPPI